jgi:hypothetical protein
VALPDVDIGTTAVVSQPVDLPRPGAHMVRSVAPNVSVRQVRADEVQVRMGRRTSPGLLVVSVALAPGWTARVDGRAAPVLRADHAFIGVRVPQDASEVWLQYRPPSLRVGIYLTLLGLAGLCALPCVALVGRLTSGRPLAAGILSAPDARDGSGERHA